MQEEHKKGKTKIDLKQEKERKKQMRHKGKRDARV